MSDKQAVADFASETYPEYSYKIQDSYIEGYDPVSYAAPHSSLLRISTWVGMGLILSILPALGIVVWGLGSMTFAYGTSSQGEQPFITLIIGVVALAVVVVAMFASIKYGRRYYRQYRKETGRIN
ncbi:membrane protein [Corynebacterium phocae]|uniref:Membrane protein n=1 Tax=Corynebacterium phocae TaxID=161895 RepID=A0A1L7D120_9CORY|nr:hypothetical protein [Corynebacterium phocae]APT91784.1 membrane protein [Corynebacterium phocae]KAA8728454.1 hypothetical protein F4V58_00900 [Corynebacterium phocae]